MAYIPGSSFIPKETNVTPKVMQRKRTFHVFGFIASAMLMTSLIAAIGVFAYGKFSEKKLEEAKVALVKEKSVDMESKMVEIAIFDRQLALTTRLLDNHIAPSRIFSELEKMTKNTVQFKSFKYTYDPGYIAELEVKGGTDELTSVAVQKIEFAGQQLFSEFSVENIALSLKTTDSGKAPAPVAQGSSIVSPVDFSISGVLNSKTVQYTGESVVDTETEVATSTGETLPADETVTSDPITP